MSNQSLSQLRPRRPERSASIRSRQSGTGDAQFDDWRLATSSKEVPYVDDSSSQSPCAEASTHLGCMDMAGLAGLGSCSDRHRTVAVGRTLTQEVPCVCSLLLASLQRNACVPNAALAARRGVARAAFLVRAARMSAVRRRAVADELARRVLVSSSAAMDEESTRAK